jgi:hypothetical protein
MTSPNGQLFIAIQDRLKDKLVPAKLKWVDQNFGQLENYEIKPSVNFPCALIDLTGFSYDDMPNGLQMGSGRVVISIGTTPFTNSSSATPIQYREKALEYYEIEHAVHTALHNWTPVPGMKKLTRRTMDKQEREDAIRERVIIFECGYTDCGAAPVTQKIATPAPTIRGEFVTPS